MTTDAEESGTSREIRVDNSPEVRSAAFDKNQHDEPVDWTSTSERRAVRKVDFSVLPLLFLGLLVFQLDRMNGNYRHMHCVMNDASSHGQEHDLTIA